MFARRYFFSPPLAVGMNSSAGDIELRRNLLKHLAQSEFSAWMSVRTSCSYIASKYNLDVEEVYRDHVQDLANQGFVEESHDGHRVTPEEAKEARGPAHDLVRLT